jgi:hypothetical protein
LIAGIWQYKSATETQYVPVLFIWIRLSKARQGPKLMYEYLVERKVYSAFSYIERKKTLCTIQVHTIQRTTEQRRPKQRNLQIAARARSMLPIAQLI